MRSLLLSCMLAWAMAVSGPAPAQTHTELQTMVQQLQANPSDSALRERIIQIARQLKPAPAIPEEARASFVQGTTIAQSAKDAAGQALAVRRFEEALKIAPWWSDALYNLAVAQELAGQLDAAQSTLKLYMLTDPGEAEARKAQDRIYALNAKKDLAAAEATTAQAQADSENVWNGRWVRDGSSFAVQSRKVGDIVEFYAPGWTFPFYRGRVDGHGNISWEMWCSSRYLPTEINVSADARSFVTPYGAYVHDNTCELYRTDTPQTFRRQ